MNIIPKKHFFTIFSIIIIVLVHCVAIAQDATDIYLDKVVDAVLENNVGILKVCNKENPEAFKYLVKEVPLLHMAAENGNVTVAEYLLFMGADLYKKNKWDETPIDVATEWADYKLLEVFVKNGANWESQRKAYLTLLAMETIFEQRNMKNGSRERHGVTRQISYRDIQYSMQVLDNAGPMPKKH